MTPHVNETPEEWEKRHEGHVTEEWTPERPFETRSLHCHDCNESAEWKGKRKINRE
jgi:hypothetical protein